MLSEVFGEVWGEIDYLGVFVGAIAYFALGGLWYAPAVFGKRWGELAGVNPQQGNQATALAIGFVAGFVAALAIGFLAVLTGVADALDGALLGLVIGVAFGLFQAISSVTFEQKSSELIWINGGYGLVGAVITGLVIGVFA
ncbi:MAG: DUF1761 domain-containing protein [Actinomycetota bacterium]